MRLSNPGSSVVSIKQTDSALARNEDADTAVGAAFIGQRTAVGAAGEYPHIQLLNPSGSGVRVYWDTLIISVDANVIVQGGVYSTAIGSSAASLTNKLPSGPAAQSELRTLSNASRLGPFHIAQRITANSVARFPFNRPFILDEGEGFIVSSNTVATILTATYEWREFAA